MTAAVITLRGSLRVRSRSGSEPARSPVGCRTVGPGRHDPGSQRKGRPRGRRTAAPCGGDEERAGTGNAVSDEPVSRCPRRCPARQQGRSGHELGGKPGKGRPGPQHVSHPSFGAVRNRRRPGGYRSADTPSRLGSSLTETPSKARPDASHPAGVNRRTRRPVSAITGESEPRAALLRSPHDDTCHGGRTRGPPAGSAGSASIPRRVG